MALAWHFMVGLVETRASLKVPSTSSIQIRQDSDNVTLLLREESQPAQ